MKMHLSCRVWAMQVIVILELYKPHINLGQAIIWLFLILSTASCSDLSQKQSDQVNKALSDSLLSTTETWGLDMKLIKKGRKKIRLRGKYASTYSAKDTSETRISGPVFIQVFDSAVTVKTRVHSDSAIYRAKSSQFELFGDVRVNTRDKRHLESEYLKWDQGGNKISTPAFVIITTPTDSIAGTGFRGTSDLSRYTIKNISGRTIVNN